MRRVVEGDTPDGQGGPARGLGESQFGVCVEDAVDGTEDVGEVFEADEAIMVGVVEAEDPVQSVPRAASGQNG